MSIRLASVCLSVGLLGVFGGGSLCAQDECCEDEGFRICRHPHEYFHHKAEIDPRHEPPLTWYERHERAGHPTCISPLADWSNTANYWGYYVGGGNPYRCGRLKGEHRYTQCDGTWGWDYAPFYSRVQLRWWHGRKYQDGEGQYTGNGKAEPFSPNHGPKGIFQGGLIK
jgi:hypothetical protein